MPGSKMNRVLGFLGCNGLAVMLAACGGGGGADPANAEDPPANFGVPYPFAASYANGEAQNDLGGVAIQSNVASGVLQMTGLSGTKDHSTRATAVSDGIYILVDANGFDAAGRLTDGRSTLALGPSASNYTSLRTFDQSYSVNGVSYDSFGVLGVVTRPGDIPTGGEATYRGSSDVIIITENEGFSVTGNSTVVARFGGSGSVDVTIDNFATTDMRTGSPTTAPIDAITVREMTIADGGFSGGTLATLRNGTPVAITGANTTGVAEGVFFGYDPALSQPDEVGGMILMQGADGTVLGNFIAD